MEKRTRAIENSMTLHFQVGLTTHSTGAEIAKMSFARIEGFLHVPPAALIRALDACG